MSSKYTSVSEILPSSKVITYFEIGKLLYEAGSNYGEDIIGKYAKKLVIEVGKKYTKSTLFRMKQFYIIFSNEKVAPFARQLSWSHYTEVLPLKDGEKILYYINQCMKLQLTRDELREKIILRRNKQRENFRLWRHDHR